MPEFLPLFMEAKYFLKGNSKFLQLYMESI